VKIILENKLLVRFLSFKFKSNIKFLFQAADTRNPSNDGTSFFAIGRRSIRNQRGETGFHTRH